tara:strand:- start:242 stop:583 length:342 start_codon:yes stop_codon:yes gene_type:complete
MAIEETIKSQIDENEILLYMKGSPEQPQCGFSAQVTQILMSCGRRFAYVDVLSNPEIRQNLPSISNWPTFPQLFVEGELVGGCDIITEMHDKGELQPLLEAVGKEIASDSNST